MPLNQAKNYKFVPTPSGPVLLQRRNSRRSRLFEGGTFFRSKEHGQQANLLRLTIVADGLTEALLVVQHTVLVPTEMIFGQGITAPEMELFVLDLNWDEELWIRPVNGTLVAEIYGIRWQISGDHTPVLRVQLGSVQANEIFVHERASFKLNLKPTDFPVGSRVVLKPRVHRYPLVITSATDPITMISATGFDPVALRATVNAEDSWIRMPNRGVGFTGPGTAGSPGEDITDTSSDMLILAEFGPTNMDGGDGLPRAPANLNTGPDRALILLNYGELENGSLGDINQVFEWVGDSALQGSWQRYS